MTPEREAQMREAFAKWADEYGFYPELQDIHQYAKAVALDSWLACARALEPMVRDAQEHERRLLWVSEHWGESTGNEYGRHVMNRCGTGDLSDMCTFIDMHFPRKKTMSAALEEEKNANQ